MTIDPTILLKQLEPAVGPAYARTSSAGPATPLEQQPFDELLAQAQQGRIESGRTVMTQYAAAEPFTGEELTRLSAAADLAEASGAKRALLLMNGRGLVLDVATRSLSGELAADTSSRMVGLDTAVYVAGEGEESAAVPLRPPGGVAPPAVGKQLDAISQSKSHSQSQSHSPSAAA
ncbi:MAG: hypothetical protein ACYSU7_13160 [Planctomycetota bacterium]|jgi:hypothetical protein